MNPPPWLSDPWWRWFLTIVFASVAAGIVTGAIFFIANWRIAARARHAAERAQRISDVVEVYTRFVTAHPLVYEGIRALILAGVKRLQDNDEIQRTLVLIGERTGQHPLKEVDPGKLKAFCDEVKVEVPLNVIGYNEALAKYRKKS